MSAPRWHIRTVTHSVQTSSVVRTEAIITTLIFEHSLRIRLKAEINDKKAGAENVPLSARASDTERSNRPVEGSTEDDDEDKDHSRSVTTASSVTAATGATTATAIPPETAGKVAGTAKAATEKEIKVKTRNFMGKINNLVTSDLANIIAGRDFLFLSKLIH